MEPICGGPVMMLRDGADVAIGGGRWHSYLVDLRNTERGRFTGSVHRSALTDMQALSTHSSNRYTKQEIVR